jgi:hypothetical protein
MFNPCPWEPPSDAFTNTSSPTCCISSLTPPLPRSTGRISSASPYKEPVGPCQAADRASPGTVRRQRRPADVRGYERALRVGGESPQAHRGRDRPGAPLGAAERAGRGHRSPRAGAENPFALPRVGPGAEPALCEGVRREDIELRRNDEVFLDAQGTERIPDPTTAGDFCRRFAESHIRSLMQAIDVARLRVWARQPKAFFRRATIDCDGRLVVTTGECKEGMDISSKGTWGITRWWSRWPRGARCCGCSTARATGLRTKARRPRASRSVGRRSIGRRGRSCCGWSSARSSMPSSSCPARSSAPGGSAPSGAGLQPEPVGLLPSLRHLAVLRAGVPKPESGRSGPPRPRTPRKHPTLEPPTTRTPPNGCSPSQR